MTEVSVRRAGWHLNIEIAGSDLVRRADQATDRSDQPIGEGKAQPDGGKEHGERQEHENSRESQLKTMPVGLEASPHVGNEPGVFRDLCRQGVDASRGIEKLPFGAGDRPNANEDVANAEEAAQSLAIQGVLKV